MTTCKHCEALRHEQQAVLDDNTCNCYPGLHLLKSGACPMSRAVVRHSRDWRDSADHDTPTCPCDCHWAARHVGRLPSLKVAT